MSSTRRPSRRASATRRVRAAGMVASAVMVAAGVWQWGTFPAHADPVHIAGSWYWAEQPDPLPSPIGTVPVPHPDVPSNDLAVSMKNGSLDKVTYLALDFSAIPSGATVTKAILTLGEDPAGTNLNTAAAKIITQPAKGFVATGSAGAPISEAPGADGSGPTAKGVRASNGTWTVDVTQLVEAEASGVKAANGIAVLPDPNSDNFETVWKGSLVTLDVTTTAPPATTLSAPEQTSVLAPTGGGSGEVSPLPPLLSAPAESVPAPPTPSISTPTPTTLPPVRLARAGRPGLTLPFFLVLLGVLGMAGLTTTVLGDLGQPVERRQGSVLRRIERRTTGLS